MCSALCCTAPLPTVVSKWFHHSIINFWCMFTVFPNWYESWRSDSVCHFMKNDSDSDCSAISHCSKSHFLTEHQRLLNQRRRSTVYHYPSLPCTLSSEVLTSAGPWRDPSIRLALSRHWVIKLHLCRQDSHSFRQAAISSCVTVFVIEVDRLTDALESASSGILPLDF